MEQKYNMKKEFIFKIDTDKKNLRFKSSKNNKVNTHTNINTNTQRCGYRNT